MGSWWCSVSSGTFVVLHCWAFYLCCLDPPPWSSPNPLDTLHCTLSFPKLVSFFVLIRALSSFPNVAMLLLQWSLISPNLWSLVLRFSLLDSLYLLPGSLFYTKTSTFYCRRCGYVGHYASHCFVAPSLAPSVAPPSFESSPDVEMVWAGCVVDDDTSSVGGAWMLVHRRRRNPKPPLHSSDSLSKGPVHSLARAPARPHLACGPACSSDLSMIAPLFWA